MKKLCITDSIFCSSAVRANIANAIVNPVNAPLVQQLSEYVTMPGEQNDQNDEDESVDQMPDESDTERDSTEDIEVDESIADEPISDSADVSDIDGVTRTETKGSELWVYIDDSLSPDSIMQSIIDTVSESNPGMKFNRLARSYNAVVFAE